MVKPGHTTDPYALGSRGMLLNPYQVYQKLRTEAPVYWSEAWNGWVLTRYKDVQAILRDDRFSSARTPSLLNQLSETQRAELQDLSRYTSLWIGFVDKPEHTRLRAIAAQALAPRLFEAMRPRIQAVTDRLIDQVQARGQLDAIGDLAYRLPATVIADLIGIPEEQRARFKVCSDQFVAFAGPSRVDLDKARQAQDGLRAIIEFLRPVYAERCRAPQADILSVLTQCQVKGDLLNEMEVLILCTALAIGGHETTTNLIGNGLLALLRHPDQLDKVRSQPELIVTAVEELLRFEPPLQRVLRTAGTDIEFGGEQIRQGQFVLAMVAAANRDPEVFPEPECLDVERQENRHLSFGQGSRFCLGAQLARMEGQVAISTLLRRLPGLRLAGSQADWHENMGFRGLKTLPLAFTSSLQ
jgi:cytochrome P450